MSRVSSATPHAADKVEKDTGIGAGVGASELEASAGETRKRKHSTVITTSSGDFDLSLLDPPRPGRPPRTASQDPAMQEARKRARVLRNRAAAQHSREKKRHHLENLEQENSELRAKNSELEERLSRAEDANAALSSKLDTLSQQFQGLQSLLLNSQKQHVPSKSASLPLPGVTAAQQQQHSLATSSMLDWNSLAVSPLHAPLDGTQTCMRSSDSSFTYTNAITNTTSSSQNTFASAAAGTPTRIPAALDASPASAPTITPSSPQNIVSSANISDSSLLTAMTDAIAATSPGSKPSAATRMHTSSVAASSDFSGKDLSESAALEQSGAHEFRVALDSQQRMPLPCTENIYRNQRLQTQSLEATLEAYSSASSSKNWAQRMASLAVAVIVSASPQSSLQSIWTMFCALLWIISQSGGSISKHQVSRIACGILEYPQQQQHQRRQTSANRQDGGSDIIAALLNKSTGTYARSWTTMRATARQNNNVNGVASLALLLSWLNCGSQIGVALRRVVGSESVDKVGTLAAELLVAVRSGNNRRHHRFRTSGAVCNKQKLFSPP
ncbi:hypothetical protein IW138_001170 [Coemansia sp. RSA 986]|nr:hypothetical protein IW138_001170 [Coemansia sp. RSA 986]